MRFRERMARFFNGRYLSFGIDAFSVFLLCLYLVISVMGSFFSLGYVRWALKAVCVAVIVYMAWRLLSKNITARRRENGAFLSAFKKTSAFFKLQKDRIRDIGKARYKKCPECKAVLRLPVKRGRHSVKCPRCGKNFDVFNLF